LEFADYVARQRPALLRFATVLTGQSWLADDLVSDVLGRAFERWSHISTLAEPHAYVRRMIVNDYVSWHRRLARTTPRAEVEPAAVSSDGAAAHAERDAMIRRLARLPRRQRAAVVLRYYLGLPDADIAAYLGCREGTVRSQISRALAALRLDPTPHHIQALQETK
jgi:RNA polymerase sigma-70 factor (sigma-E family)